MNGLKTLKKRRRIQIVILMLVSLALSTGLIGYAMRDGINYYISPADLLASPPSNDEVFRLGGLVVEGTLIRDSGTTHHFDVTDGVEVVSVSYTGIFPQ